MPGRSAARALRDRRPALELLDQPPLDLRDRPHLGQVVGEDPESHPGSCAMQPAEACSPSAEAALEMADPPLAAGPPPHETPEVRFLLRLPALRWRRASAWDGHGPHAL